jgi:hypothetical protein
MSGENQKYVRNSKKALLLGLLIDGRQILPVLHTHLQIFRQNLPIRANTSVYLAALSLFD